MNSKDIQVGQYYKRKYTSYVCKIVKIKEQYNYREIYIMVSDTTYIWSETLFKTAHEGPIIGYETPLYKVINS